jgi:GDPmannose 4,6-dehydratase
MTKKTALITGVNGQDGILLSKLLIEKGYEVIGAGRQAFCSEHLHPRVRYQSVDVRDTNSLINILKTYRVDELYNLAGLSSVAFSYKEPELTFAINSTAVKNLLVAIADGGLFTHLRFYQASSSEMYGESARRNLCENDYFDPISPYAESKVEALAFCKEFQSRGFFVCSGILFNHESIYRPMKFVTRKVTSQVALLSRGELDHISIGNLDSVRDWGYAGDYVVAMWKMLQVQEAQEFVIATGVPHSVKDLISFALGEVGLEDQFESVVKVEKNLMRVKDVSGLTGDSGKAFELLNWSPTWTFEDTIRSMVRHDLNRS